MQVDTDVIWHDDADVVVIGLGAAGAAAALAAERAGAQTLVLEKQQVGLGPELGNHYSTSHMSGGVFLQPTHHESTLTYLNELSRCSAGGGVAGTDSGWSDSDLIRAYADNAMGVKDWLLDLGADLTPAGEGAEHGLTGAETFQRFRFAGSGLGMMRFFEEQLRAAAGIQVAYSRPARTLLTDQAGTVIGVQANVGGPDGPLINIRARRGVVMALGGFQFDERMKLNYLRSYPNFFAGTEASTGDGIRMAIDVGADLWHMNCVSARFVAKFPEFPNAITILMPLSRSKPATGYVLVDKYGRRYTNERLKAHTAYYEASLFDSQKLEFPRIPSYWIFDSRRMNASKLCVQTSGITGPMKRYEWSAGNQTELERGWITMGNTPAELSAQLGIEGDELSRTVESWNRACADGYDSTCGRSRDLVPLDAPPFFGVKVWPGGPNTQGGAKRNAQTQIMNVDGQPVGRLYGAGEFGSMFGMHYTGGGNLSECFAMGAIAGANAARRGDAQLSKGMQSRTAAPL